MSTAKELIDELVKRFKPEQAKDWDRIINWTISGSGWHMIIKDQKCEVKEGKHESPNLEVETDIDTLSKVLKGEVDVVSVFMAGKLKAKGPMSDLMKLREVFGF